MTASRAPALSMDTCHRVAEKLAFALCDLRVSLAEGSLDRSEIDECRNAVKKLENIFDGDGPRRTPQCGTCPGCGPVRDQALTVTTIQ